MPTLVRGEEEPHLQAALYRSLYPYSAMGMAAQHGVSHQSYEVLRMAIGPAAAGDIETEWRRSTAQTRRWLTDQLSKFDAIRQKVREAGQEPCG